MKYFKAEEFKCRCGCEANLIENSFVLKLDDLREQYGRPMVVSSGYRCPKHNAAVSSTGATGPHTTGRAVDIAISRAEAVLLLAFALAGGTFTGFGINQKGGARFLHLDDLPNGPGVPRPTIWSY